MRRVVDEDASRTNLLNEVKADGGAYPEGTEVSKRLCDGEAFLEGTAAVLDDAKGEAFPVDDQDAPLFKPFE